MKMTTLMLFAITVISIAGCDHDDDDKTTEEVEVASFCPSTSDDVTWHSYGTFELNNAGRDSTARRIISECGWHVRDGFNGGYGNTLQIASPNEEVVFIWAYNSFYGFVLSGGWEGLTHKGAMMDDHVSDFYGLHPEFYYRKQGWATHKSGDISVRVYFDEYDFLEKIYVGDYYVY